MVRLQHVSRLTCILMYLQLVVVQVGAQESSGLVINEIFPNPDTKDDAGEWIELYNNSESAIQLDGILLDDDQGGSAPFTLSGLLEPHQRLILFKEATKLELNNTQETVRLLTQNGQIIDSYTYANAAQQSAYARIPDGSNNWEKTETPTPNQPNSPPADNTPTAVSRVNNQEVNITLSEVYACPETGAEEWVELHNKSSTQVSVLNWHLVDAADHKVELSFELIGGGYYVATLTSPILNNSGDTVKLVGPDGVVVDHMSYTDCSSQFSYIPGEGGWITTTSVTKNLPNQFSPLPSATVRTAQAPTQKPTSASKIIPSIPHSPSPEADRHNQEESSLSPTLKVMGIASISSQLISTQAGIINASSLSGDLQEASISASDSSSNSSTHHALFTLASGFVIITGVLASKYHILIKYLPYHS